MAIRIGGHVSINKRLLGEVQQFYKDASSSITYTIGLIDRTPSLGRVRIYVNDPRDGSRLCLYRRHLVGVPFCHYCGKEGHTKAKATRNNCECIAKEQKERREAKRAAKKAVPF